MGNYKKGESRFWIDVFIPKLIKGVQADVPKIMSVSKIIGGKLTPKVLNEIQYNLNNNNGFLIGYPTGKEYVIEVRIKIFNCVVPIYEYVMITPMLTPELLKEYFYYKDGFLYWKKRRKTGNGKINEIAGSQCRRSKYRFLRFQGRQYLLHRVIFLFHKGYLPEVVDHEDRDPANCRIENLRDATFSQNSVNRKKIANCSSKYIGVFRNKKNNAWDVAGRINGKRTHIGSFKTENEAALAYNKFAVMYYKEFANLNIIQLEQ